MQNKFYFFDTGVFRAIRPTGPLDSDAEQDGPALETLVLQQIRALNDYMAFDYQIAFWRTRHKLEIDFILYGQYGLLAIEIKRSRQLQHKDTRALREFKNDYPAAKCYIFYGGNIVLYLDSITALPINDALKNLPAVLENNAP